MQCNHLRDKYSKLNIGDYLVNLTNLHRRSDAIIANFVNSFV